MKNEKIFLKISSAALSAVMAFSSTGICAMAATLPPGAYENVTSSASAYTLDNFKTDFAAATYTAVETFENENANVEGSTTTKKANLYPFVMDVTGVENGTCSLKLSDGDSKSRLYLFSDTTGLLSSANGAVRREYKSSDTNPSLKFEYKTPDGYNSIRVGGAAQENLQITTFAIVIRPAADAAISFNVKYTDGTQSPVDALAFSGGTNHFWGYKANEGKYISEVLVTTDKEIIVDDLSLIFKNTAEDTQTAQADLDAITLPSVVDKNTTSITLVTVGDVNATPITWTAGEGSAIDASGNVTHPAYGSATGTLTATAGEVSKDFTVKVEGLNSWPTFENGMYSKEGMIDGAQTLATFVEKYNAAEHKTALTFENGGFSPTDGNSAGTMRAASLGISVGDGESGTYNLLLDRTGSTKPFIHTAQSEEGIYSSGKNAMRFNSNGSPLIFKSKYFRESDNATFNMVTGHVEYDLTGFAWAVYADSGETVHSFTVTYDDDTTSTTTTTLSQGNTYFFFADVPSGKKYIKDISISVNKNVILDDLVIIVDEVVDPIATKVIINGVNTVQTPVYGVAGSNQYTYEAYVADQFDRKMEGKEVTLSISGENDAITFDSSSGKLTVSKMDSVPTELKLTARAVDFPEMTPEELPITVQNASYFNSAYISTTKKGEMVGETTSARDENDTTGDRALTRDEFAAMIDDAIATDGKDMAIINFDSDALTMNSSAVKMPLHKGGQSFTLGAAARNMSFPSIDENGMEGGGDYRVIPVSGDTYLYLNGSAQGGNEYLLNTDSLGDLRATAMGFVILSYSGLSVADGFRVIATYSNGKIGYFSQNTTGNKKQTDEQKIDNNVFFGIKAPAGHYITNVIIQTSANSNKAYARLDEFGFVFEVPDIINIERDYSQLKFSDISSEDMGNIRSNLDFGSVKNIGTSTITWRTEPAGIFDENGVITPPDTPAADGTTQEVKLIGTFSSGVLTKERIFELYVPSKLEMDRDAITLPSEASADITLPTTGAKYGSVITWTPGRNSAVSSDGTVTRPQSKDQYSLLTATLSNPQDSSKFITKDFGITVKAINSSSSSGGSGGSGGGGGGGSIAAPTVIPPQKEPVEIRPSGDNTVYDSVFHDLDTKHWAYDSIKELYEKGIVNGTGENSFEPEGSVTREQYLAMLIRAFGFETTQTGATFTDVSEDAWYYDIVLIAQKLGISNGYADGSFGIGKNITREEMAVMAYRAAEAAGILLDSDESDIAWNDAAEISEFAANAVSALNKAEIIKGISDSVFSPKTTATRAQSAVIISRLLEVNAVYE